MRSDERYFAARRGALLGRLRFLKTEGGKKKWTSWVVENNGLETRKLFEAPFVGQSLESYGDNVVMNARGNIVYFGRLWKDGNDFDEYELAVQDAGPGRSSFTIGLRRTGSLRLLPRMASTLTFRIPTRSIPRASTSRASRVSIHSEYDPARVLVEASSAC